MPILPIQETPCQALAGPRYQGGRPPAPTGMGAVSIPGIGVVDTKWLLIAAAVVVALILIRGRRKRRRIHAKRIIRRVTEY